MDDVGHNWDLVVDILPSFHLQEPNGFPAVVALAFSQAFDGVEVETLPSVGF